MKAKKDLDVMFADIVPLHTMSSVAVEQAKTVPDIIEGYLSK